MTSENARVLGNALSNHALKLISLSGIDVTEHTTLTTFISKANGLDRHTFRSHQTAEGIHIGVTVVGKVDTVLLAIDVR